MVQPLIFLLQEKRQGAGRRSSLKMVEIGSCSLHIIHLAFLCGAVSTGWNIKSILTSLHALFENTSARVDDYIKLNVSEVMPLLFCSTRWVESKAAAQRAIQVWPDMTKIVKFWNNLPSSKTKTSHCNT